MARYRKVDVRVWRDGFFSVLEPDAKLLWLYLIASPQTTSAGLFCFDITRAMKDTGLQRGTFDRAFREVLRQAGECGDGIPAVRWDEENGVIWLPNFLRYNSPESPNVVVSWRNYMDEIPETTPLLPEWYSATKAFMVGKGKAFTEAFRKVCPHPYEKAFNKPMPNPDPDPDPEPEHEVPARTRLSQLERVVQDTFSRVYANSRYGNPPRWDARSYGEKIRTIVLPYLRDLMRLSDMTQLEPERVEKAIEQATKKYLRDSDDWPTGKRHSFGVFVGNLEQYVPLPKRKS